MRGSKGEGEGNEVVVRGVQRGYSDIGARAIPQKNQVEEVARLVGRGR